MDSISVRLPDKLLTKVEEKAEKRGIDTSKQIRNDLLNQYFED